MDRVLIVDDEEGVRNTLDRILTRRGYKCFGAHSADEARKILAQEAVDLILCDIKMPHESGVEFIRNAMAAYPDIATVMVTGVDDPEMAKSVVDLGVYGYIVKPFSSAQVLISAINALKRRELAKKVKTHTETLEKAVVARTAELEQRLNELEKARGDLIESEERYRTAIEMANDGVVIASDGKILYVNRKFAEMYGHDRPDVIIGEPVSRFVHPDDAARVRNAQNLREKGEVTSPMLEVRCRRKNGEPITVDVSSSRILYQGRPCSLSFMRDITDKKRAEEALKESEETFRAIAVSAQDGIIQTGPNGRITFWNRSAEKVFGYSREEAIGRNLHDLLSPPRYHEDCTKAFIAFSETGHGAAVGKTVELIGVRKGGEEFPLELSLSAVQIKGEWNAIGIVRDISERKRLEYVLTKKTKSLDEVKEKLLMEQKELKNTQSVIIHQEKMASIGQLAAGVAHEINNPTGFISSNLKTLSDYLKDLFGILKAYQNLCAGLKKDASPENRFADPIRSIEEREYAMDLPYILEDTPKLLDESREGMERIKGIVQDLKDFAHPGKQEQGYADINKNLDSTLNIVWSELKYKAKVEKDYGELPEVRCYPQQLNQVFMNLLVNAGQAIAKEGVITITTRAVNSHVVVQIRDTGIGIPEENFSRIFDPFFTTKEVGKGTGLGLNVAYNIIQKHHGGIEVESTVGQGTTFTVRVPADWETPGSRSKRIPSR